MKRTLVVCLICLCVAAGCSIKNARITAQNKEQLLEDAAWSRGITGEQAALLSSAFKESALTGVPIEGKTIGEVLAEQERLRAEDEAARLARAGAAEEQVRKAQEKYRLETYATVTAVKKVFMKSAVYDGVFDGFTLVYLNIDNISGKVIKTLSGRMAFRDKSGRVLLTRVITYYGPYYGDITVGERRMWISKQRNPENDPDGSFRITPLEKLSFEFQTHRIVFADGQCVGAECAGTE
jgi:hypothetical protein